MHRIYKPFLEHISQGRTTRCEDRYLLGDPRRVQQHDHKKQLTPSEVLRLIEACGLVRDAFLIVLLYNTCLGIGEPFGIAIHCRCMWGMEDTGSCQGGECSGGDRAIRPLMRRIIHRSE